MDGTDLRWTERREPRQAAADEARTPWEVDYARVIHSASFRRLQGKTQILNLGDSDFYRTRLTHSLEVAQIADGLVRQLRHDHPQHPALAIVPDRSLIQTIGCAHDLGHPPFGHGGEIALNYCMRGAGGFEGNGQTLRLLSRLEAFSQTAGANLTRRSLLGVLKYPAPFSALHDPGHEPALADGPSTLKLIDVALSTPPKCYLDSEAEVVDWVLAPLSASDRLRFAAVHRGTRRARTLHKSLDCSLMDIADDIAYGVHDLEDAVALGLISPDAVEAAIGSVPPSKIRDGLVSALFGSGTDRKRRIGQLVHHFITAIHFVEEPDFEEPLLRWRVRLAEGPAAFLKALKDLVMAEVIRGPGVQQLEFKGQGMVVAVFEALQSDPMRLLPRDARARFVRGEGDPRVICDFVAGMTDTYLLRTYERLFAPRMGSVFDRI